MMRYRLIWAGVLSVMVAGSCLVMSVSAQVRYRYTTPRRSGQSATSSTRVRTTAPAKGKSKTDKPKWATVEKTVKGTFAKMKDYRPGDLITQDDAAKIFPVLKSEGWEIKDSKELTKRLLPASDEMVSQLRGQRGKKFMREIGSVPKGYDRLDKLRNLPYGSRRLRELINQPGGYTMIQYMATTPGGQKMGRQLSSPQRGNFNAPTDRIYTGTDLLAVLKAVYHAENPPVGSPSR